ncbi:protein ELC-like [Wolffia australiana]
MVQPQPPAVANGQNWSQFLSGALSQRGPNALPYAEDVKWLIRQHLISLLEAFPSLPPKSSVFTHNDGRSLQLLQVEGTIPILFGGVVYNIPAVIWLLESYPRSPPSVFLTPTRDMVIQRNHPYVDRSGHVNVAYLQNWIYPSSNLVDLVRLLSRLFGQHPPLYTRRDNPNPPPPSDPTPPRIRRPTEDPAEVYRRNAVAKLLETIHGDIAALRKSREQEVEDLFSKQAALRRRAEELAAGLREMQEEKEGLEQMLQIGVINSDLLGDWVGENLDKVKGDGGSVDEVFEPCDALSRQLVECTAADMAAEDTLYSLDKAVQEGVIPFDAYLKNVRALSREQFFHRAMAMKVRASQVQSQVSAMATRARPLPS